MRGGLRRTAGTLAATLVLGLLTVPTARAEGQLADAADALAVAITHAHHLASARRIA